MNPVKSMKSVKILAIASFYSLAMLPLASCGGGGEKPAAAHDDHDHDHDHAHDHGDEHAHTDGGEHGPTTELGQVESGGFTVKVAREGDVKAGSDVPIDVSVTGAKKVSAVRIWIGSEDAKGSIKAKADAEGDHWHAHVEIPDPLPAGAKAWIEVESEGGANAVVGVDLKL